jgi:hypothetical protein
MAYDSNSKQALTTHTLLHANPLRSSIWAVTALDFRQFCCSETHFRAFVLPRLLCGLPLLLSPTRQNPNFSAPWPSCRIGQWPFMSLACAMLTAQPLCRQQGSGYTSHTPLILQSLPSRTDFITPQFVVGGFDKLSISTNGLLAGRPERSTELTAKACREANVRGAGYEATSTLRSWEGDGSAVDGEEQP